MAVMSSCTSPSAVVEAWRAARRSHCQLKWVDERLLSALKAVRSAVGTSPASV